CVRGFNYGYYYMESYFDYW
nr:immunoglobulin heavy chain junction region [Macaca mulatta]MOX14983.1 immunoglobulin heavy chain junction region [Macaca mulatta]MOX15796.1 immunoglobulin heavy chain junction region [Macaca mulatta]